MSEGDVETEPGKGRESLAVFNRIGSAIRLLREEQGLSLASLAKLARAGKSQLSKYETGKEMPRLDSLARILDALGVSPLTIVYWAARLARDVSQTDIRAEMLDAEARHDAGSRPFTTLLSAALEAHEAYLEARMPGRPGRKERAG